MLIAGIVWLIGFIVCACAIYWYLNKSGGSVESESNFEAFFVAGISVVWPVVLILLVIWYFAVYRETDEEDIFD